MLVNFDTSNRTGLKPEQQEFLWKLVPLGQLIQDWSYHKAHFKGIYTECGLLTSVFIASVLIESGWGNHPISQTKYNGKYSNNLALLEIDEFWSGKSRLYDGIKYRAYADWRDFATDYTDYIVFSGKFLKLLLTSDPADQIKLLKLTKSNSKCYNIKNTTLIDFYNLQEFDLKYGKS